MPEKSQKQMLQELYTAVLGVPGTDDDGLVGEIKETKKLVKEQNRRVQKNTSSIARIYGIGGACVFIIGVVIAVLQLIG